MRKIVVIASLLIVLVAAAWYMFRGEEETTTYRFVPIERGDLESTVSATGGLNAVRTVEVGTQVSGQVAEILVDFNDTVKKGQLVARIDPTLLRLAVDDSKANLQRAEAELLQAEREFARKKSLFESKVLTEEEFNAAEYALAIARASLTRAKVDLTRAERNLAYTQIYAPVDGVVIERNVDVGQTVAASLSAPVLFLIAEDLSKLEILAAVDESDIGTIKEGQDVRFTVQAYPDDVFRGVVRQVRLQSTSQENVVNYTVVVDVHNPDGRLLPGMTATVDFLVEHVEGVFKVANAALRFQPSEDMITEMRARMEQQTAAGDSARRPPSGTPGGWQQGGGAATPAAQRPAAGGNGSRNIARLWYFDEQGQIQMLRARTGITDGQFTQVIGEGVQEGLQIIAGMTQTASTTSLNPFQSQTEQRRPGPPGPF